MKCQMLFSRKNKKHIISISSAEVAHSTVSIQCLTFSLYIAGYKFKVCSFYISWYQ